MVGGLRCSIRVSNTLSNSLMSRSTITIANTIQPAKNITNEYKALTKVSGYYSI